MNANYFNLLSLSFDITRPLKVEFKDISKKQSQTVFSSKKGLDIFPPVLRVMFDLHEKTVKPFHEKQKNIQLWSFGGLSFPFITKILHERAADLLDE